MLNSNFNRRSVKSRLPAPISRWSRSCRGSLAGKAITFFFTILVAAGLNSSRAQDTWTQKANFGGVARQEASGFAIGNKTYIGTGWNGNSLKDFWEWDPVMDFWTQKADFGGGITQGAFHFSIGTKGYIGMGYDQTTPYPNDFWEWDQTTNLWTQKANFPGTPREDGASFSIGTKGYIGCGLHGNTLNDFWEWDQGSNTWTQKANFGGASRVGTIGFSIGSKGYIGVGHNGSTLYKDFWEYDPAADTWIQKADFGGVARSYPSSFVIGTNGYIGTGWDEGSNFFNDVWAWNQSTNTWTQQANFGGGKRSWATGFSLNGTGYMGTGARNGVWFDDFWEYTPDTSSCLIPTNLSVTNITSSSAKLKWDAVAGAEGYKVRYKVSGTSDWAYSSTTGHSKNLNNLSPNTSYTWGVKTYCSFASNLSSHWSAKQKFTTGTARMGDESLQQISFQIYPNPAKDHATIQFTLPQSSHVCIKVHEISGKEITTLLNDDVEQGDHSLPLNTQYFSKGVYMVRMISDFGIENQKLIVQ